MITRITGTRAGEGSGWPEDAGGLGGGVGVGPGPLRISRTGRDSARLGPRPDAARTIALRLEAPHTLTGGFKQVHRDRQLGKLLPAVGKTLENPSSTDSTGLSPCRPLSPQSGLAEARVRSPQLQVARSRRSELFSSRFTAGVTVTVQVTVHWNLTSRCIHIGIRAPGRAPTPGTNL
jgi:hypothetical protein